MSTVPSSFLFNQKAGSGPFAGIPRPATGTASLQQKAQYARDQGYQVRGNYAYLPGSPARTALTYFRPNNSVGLMDQAGAALGQDINFLKENVQAPYMTAMGEFKEAAESAPGQIRDAAGQAVGRMDAFSNEVAASEQGLDDRLSVGARFLEDVYKDVGGQADRLGADSDSAYQAAVGDLSGFDVGPFQQEARDYAKRAVESAQRAAGSYNADSAAFGSSLVRATERRVENEMALLNAGVDPSTGMPMNPADQAAAQAKLASAVWAETVPQYVAFSADAQKTLAGLRQFVAQTEMAAGDTALKAGALGVEAAAAKADAVTKAASVRDQTKLGALGVKAQLGAEAGRAKAEAAVAGEQVRSDNRRIRADMANSSAQMLNAAGLAAVQAQVSGRAAYADMIRNVPYISVFEAFMALANMSSAGGGMGARLPALNLPR